MKTKNPQTRCRQKKGRLVFAIDVYHRLYGFYTADATLLSAYMRDDHSTGFWGMITLSWLIG